MPGDPPRQDAFRPVERARRGVVGATELDVEARGLLEVVPDDRLELADLIFGGASSQSANCSCRRARISFGTAS